MGVKRGTKLVRQIRFRKQEASPWHHRGEDNGPLTPEQCRTIAGAMENKAAMYEAAGFHKLAATCRDFARQALRKSKEREGARG